MRPRRSSPRSSTKSALTCSPATTSTAGSAPPLHSTRPGGGLGAPSRARPRRVFQSTINRDHFQRARQRFADQAAEADIEAPDIDDEAFGMPESIITAEVDVTPYLAHKRRAMRAHASQISEQSFFLAML